MPRRAERRARDELSGFGAPRHSTPRVLPPLVSGPGTALKPGPAVRAGASGECFSNSEACIIHKLRPGIIFRERLSVMCVTFCNGR